MKKFQKIAVLLLAVILVVIAGCSTGKPPKEALQAAMTKTSQADSYAIKMSIGLDELEIPQDAAMQGDAAATSRASRRRGHFASQRAMTQRMPQLGQWRLPGTAASPCCYPGPSPAATTQLPVSDAGEALGGQRRGRVDGSAGVGQRLHQGPGPGPLGLVVVVDVIDGVTVPRAGVGR